MTGRDIRVVGPDAIDRSSHRLWSLPPPVDWQSMGGNGISRIELNITGHSPSNGTRTPKNPRYAAVYARRTQLLA
jgi:hypothetical protein